MAKQIIGVDVDDVLVPHFEGLIDWYNQKYGTKLTLAHNHPSDTTPFGVPTIAEAVKRVHGYFDSSEFKAEQPYIEAVEALKKLSVSYDLVVITGRDEIIEMATREWLERCFPKLFREVHFTAQYSLEGKSRSKANVAQSLGVHYFVEDHLKTALEVSETGCQVLLFGDFPWNQSTNLPTNVIRCPDWAAVLEYFDGRS